MGPVSHEASRHLALLLATVSSACPLIVTAGAFANFAVSASPHRLPSIMPTPKAVAQLYTAAASPPHPSPHPAPTRQPDGTLIFADVHDFRPNLQPDEVLQLGSFGGGYFRTIKSSVTKQVHDRAWEEFPKSWFEGLVIDEKVASNVYNPAANRYGVRSGKTAGKKDSFGLQAWEESGWIVEQDPFGWFQWYCRFFSGRRSEDDDRQIGRWAAMCGAKGRWKRNLIARCVREGKAFDDVSCAPVVRQTLQHWAYRLSEADFLSYKAEIAGGARTAFISAASMPTLDPPQQPPGSVETSPGTSASHNDAFRTSGGKPAREGGKGAKNKSTGKPKAVNKNDTGTLPTPKRARR